MSSDVVLCFPETVQIAVFVNRDDLIIRQNGKIRLGCFTGMEFFYLAAGFGTQGYKVNVMGIEHGMLH